MVTKIITEGGGGVTSCLSVRLHEAIRFYEANGKFPDEIDSSKQFFFYKDNQSQNVSAHILGEYVPNNDLQIVNYSHDWQFRMYDEIQLEDLFKLANNICPMSNLVGDRSYDYMHRIEDRTAVLYRGNDKALDVPRTHYNAMIEMAKATGSDKFIVQTDEIDFFDFFKSKFPNSIYFSDIPRIKKDPDAYVMPPQGYRLNFCINFLAALRAIATADKLILNTGNTGIWTMLFRGHTNNVWQVHGRNQQWRKLK